MKKTVLFSILGIVLSLRGMSAYAAETFFNAPEAYSTDISPFYKWTGLLARMDSHPQTLQPWLDNKKLLEGLPPREMAQKVDDIVNQYAYISDARNWGVSDYWETPTEFFARGGDCEDFVIAKYAWLRSLGIPEDRLRVAIVHDRIRGVPHALLILYINNKPLVLDSQVKEIRDARAITRYRLIYSINRLGWWYPEKQWSDQISTRNAKGQTEPASGGDNNIQFSRECLTESSLPQCINAVEPD